MADKFDTSTTDAQVWAEEFISRIKDNPEIATDEGTMLGWFANAIMAGYDEARRKYEMTNAHEATMRHVLGDSSV
ncbi:hypothetical protein SEA_EMMA1919_11 [Streptomyces phage Emma1919]|nr:hypothetical protein SEA_EMMA1919_11 [Streptomyces phage Emma1919]